MSVSDGAPPSSTAPIVGYEVVRSEELGRGGYLRLRRVFLRNRRADGTLSNEFFCEFVDRPRHGTDAVVVVLYTRTQPVAAEPLSSVLVLLRQGLRPALRFGRDPARLTVPDRGEYLFLTELVAGILEDEDRGEAGLRRRASLECREEAGLTVPPEAFAPLGARIFPTPGMAPEAFHLLCAEVDPTTALAPTGDGSPMEEGAGLAWVPLAEALARCERGEIEDAKTELGLRRLAARLAAGSI